MLEVSSLVKNDKVYVLPSWRVSEIGKLLLKHLIEEGFYKDDFNYFKMIKRHGIELLKFSNMKKENREKCSVLLENYKSDGFYYADSDSNGNICKMIFYDDNKSDMEVMRILMHEYGHVVLNHTQQCPNGETEADFSSLFICFLLCMEKKFHIAKKIVERYGKTIMSDMLNEIFEICIEKNKTKVQLYIDK